MAEPLKTLTVRLPEDLYRNTAEVARKRGVSLNRLVQESLAQIIRDAHAAELYDAFSLVGEDAEETNVEFALQAQWEVVTDEPATPDAR